MDKKKGIYLIHCVKSNKVYIGSSANINRRWWDHRSHMNQGKGINVHLQSAWTLYGKSAFTFSILEECPIEQFIERESYWIRLYSSTDKTKGYNIDIPDEVTTKYPETRNERKQIVSTVGCPIIVINRSTGVIKEYTNAGEAQKELGIKTNKINDIKTFWKKLKEGIELNNYKRFNKEYTFIRKEDYDLDFDYITYKPIKKKRAFGYKMEPRSNSRRAQLRRGEVIKELTKTKSIIVTSINTRIEVVYPSIASAIKELDLTKVRVFRCLRYPEKSYTHKGYKFRYA
jgi:group I intron endonuclease